MIKKICIQNFKSIRKAEFDFSNDFNHIICFIGKNGSGKSNIFKAINYFFKYINKPYSEEAVIDNSNPYIQKCSISITFDINLLCKKATHNEHLKKQFDDIFIYNNHNTNLQTTDTKIELKMTQYRDGTINWNINNESICNTLKNSFPVYYIDTRHLDIYTWDKLWNIISDLSAAAPQKTQEETEKLLDETFEKIYGDKYSHSKVKIEQDFKKYGITLDRYNFDSKYKMAFSMRFGGEHFMVDGHNLNYYSDGTSSFNYLKLLTSLIPKISELSCKYPIMLMDEPEIGLHNALVTEFVDCLCESINKNALAILSTHSAKLIADLSCRASGKYSLYKIIKKGFYSKLSKMNTKWIDESFHKVTVRETECYFSESIVYVEGETEVQLFSHPKILELFEKLKNVHFYSFDSNNNRLETAHSRIINLGIPYKVLIDMDKILNYCENKKIFYIKQELLVNPLSKNGLKYYSKEREKYKYFSMDSNNVDLITLRNQIAGLQKKQYSFNEEKQYIDDADYNQLMKLIIEYCSYYNTIVNWSTIEGELITYENIEEFIKFTEKVGVKNDLEHVFICSRKDIKQKTVLMLGAFNGKNEIITKVKIPELKQGNNGAITPENKMRSVSREVDKTNGWVKEWISYVFETKIDILQDRVEKKAQFKKLFPNLFCTLQIIENMV